MNMLLFLFLFQELSMTGLGTFSWSIDKHMNISLASCWVTHDMEILSWLKVSTTVEFYKFEQYTVHSTLLAFLVVDLK